MSTYHHIYFERHNLANVIASNESNHFNTAASNQPYSIRYDQASGNALHNHVFANTRTEHYAPDSMFTEITTSLDINPMYMPNYNNENVNFEELQEFDNIVGNSDVQYQLPNNMVSLDHYENIYSDQVNDKYDINAANNSNGSPNENNIEPREFMNDMYIHNLDNMFTPSSSTFTDYGKDTSSESSYGVTYRMQSSNYRDFFDKLIEQEYYNTVINNDGSINQNIVTNNFNFVAETQKPHIEEFFDHQLEYCNIRISSIQNEDMQSGKDIALEQTEGVTSGTMANNDERQSDSINETERTDLPMERPVEADVFAFVNDSISESNEGREVQEESSVIKTERPGTPFPKCRTTLLHSYRFAQKRKIIDEEDSASNQPLPKFQKVFGTRGAGASCLNRDDSDGGDDIVGIEYNSFPKRVFRPSLKPISSVESNCMDTSPEAPLSEPRESPREQTNLQDIMMDSSDDEYENRIAKGVLKMLTASPRGNRTRWCERRARYANRKRASRGYRYSQKSSDLSH